MRQIGHSRWRSSPDDHLADSGAMGDFALLVRPGRQLAEPGFLPSRRPDQHWPRAPAIADVAQAVGRRSRLELDGAAVKGEASPRPREIAAALVEDPRLPAAIARIGNSGGPWRLGMGGAAGEQQWKQQRAHRTDAAPAPGSNQAKVRRARARPGPRA